MTVNRPLGAQFEISIDGTPRTYRDLKPLAIEAAELLKRNIRIALSWRRTCGAAKRQRLHTNLTWDVFDDPEQTEPPAGRVNGQGLYGPARSPQRVVWTGRWVERIAEAVAEL